METIILKNQARIGKKNVAAFSHVQNPDFKWTWTRKEANREEEVENEIREDNGMSMINVYYINVLESHNEVHYFVQIK